MTRFAVVLRVTPPHYAAVELPDTRFVEAGPESYTSGWTTPWGWPHDVWPAHLCFATREAALAEASERQRAFDAGAEAARRVAEAARRVTVGGNEKAKEQQHGRKQHER